MTESLRDRVLRAATDYIAQSGAEGLSFRQIAADAGVSHQAPYHHFGDRGAIFAEIALRGFRGLADALSAPPRPDEDDDLAVRLCERYVRFALENRGSFRVMFRRDLCQVEDFDEVRTAGDEAFHSLLNAVERIVGPSASVEDVRLQATLMWSVAHGLATLLLDGPLEGTMGEVADAGALARAVARRIA